MSRSATALWRISPALVAALAEHLGEPLDSYVNGSQTWLTERGPGDITLEWRLHPAPAYTPPTDGSHYELWEHTVADPDAVPRVWDGLECFPAYGDDLEPAPLARAATELIGFAPDACGLVDHEAVGRAWEKSKGTTSLTDALFAQLGNIPGEAG